MKNGFIIMTALPPTKGHLGLILWARQALTHMSGENAALNVLVCGRPQEPISIFLRANALEVATREYGIYNTYFHMHNSDPPQNPGEHPDFWNIWRDIVYATQGVKPGDFLFASEEYGVKFAEVLQMDFMPFDQSRRLFGQKATEIRKHPLLLFHHMVKPLQAYYRKHVVFFGQESTGKSFHARTMAVAHHSVCVPEWARGYLELVGPEVTDEKMRNIEIGQKAAEQIGAVRAVDTDSPFVFYDTDLLSTIGYYRLYRGSETETSRELFEPKNLYIVMHDGIPFVPDQLRYGGDRRESTRQFWIDLLEEFRCRYYVVQSTDMAEQNREIEAVVQGLFDEDTSSWAKFERT